MSRSPDAVVAGGAVCWKIVDGEVRILLVHRTQHKDVSLPKGKVDPGETVPHTAQREILEETGLHITDPSHIEQFDRQLTRGMSDDMQSWTLNSDGEWRRRSHAEDGTKLGDVQHETMMDIMGRKRGVPTG